MPGRVEAQTAPGTCAVLTMELQQGVVGFHSTFPELAAEVARHHLLESTARLLAAARRRSIPVVHCAVAFRSDRAGTSANCRLMAAVLRDPKHLLAGTASADLAPEIGAEPGDLVSIRSHGVSPFTGTELDAWLRNLGVSTVIATGVSVNLGVLGLVIEAVNLGYEVVVPRDAVAGVPAEYAASILAHTFPLIATLTTTDDIVRGWQRS